MTSGPHDTRGRDQPADGGGEPRLDVVQLGPPEAAETQEPERSTRYSALAERADALWREVTRLEAQREHLRGEQRRLRDEFTILLQRLEAADYEAHSLSQASDVRRAEAMELERGWRLLFAKKGAPGKETAVAETGDLSEAVEPRRDGADSGVKEAPVLSSVAAVARPVSPGAAAQVLDSGVRDALESAERRRFPLAIAFAVAAIVLALASGVTLLRDNYPPPSASEPPPPDPARPPVPPPGPEPTAPATPSDIKDRFDEVDAALHELVAGRIAFNAPERMQFRDTHVIALIGLPNLDADTLASELRDRIGGKDPIAVATLQMAALMEAGLEGAPAFAVTPLTATRQPVSRDAPTEWRWSVRAEEAGRHPLHLTMHAIIMVDGERFARSVNVLNREIDVDITTVQWSRLFLERNWEWLGGTILIPLTVWLWKNRTRRDGTGRRKRRRK